MNETEESDTYEDTDQVRLKRYREQVKIQREKAYELANQWREREDEWNVEREQFRETIFKLTRENKQLRQSIDDWKQLIHKIPPQEKETKKLHDFNHRHQKDDREKENNVQPREKEKKLVLSVEPQSALSSLVSPKLNQSKTTKMALAKTIETNKVGWNRPFYLVRPSIQFQLTTLQSALDEKVRECERLWKELQQTHLELQRLRSVGR